VKIRMLVEMPGTRNGEPWPAKGEVAELPTAEAAHLCSCEVAEPAEDAEETEQASGQPRRGRRSSKPREAG
jgi:hypothetical protein